MIIRHTLYSDELTEFAPEGGDVHAWTRDVYAPALEAAYLAEWPDATIDIEVVAHTTGVGSGVRLIDDEGMEMPDTAIDAREISGRVLESLSQAPDPSRAPGEMGRQGETKDAEDAGDLYDYHSGDWIRPATTAELAASEAAGEQDGGRGVIEIDGRAVYAIA